MSTNATAHSEPAMPSASSPAGEEVISRITPGVKMFISTIVAMNVLTPGVMREMTSSPAGLLALCVAGVLWGVAFVLIRATTKVEL